MHKYLAHQQEIEEKQKHTKELEDATMSFEELTKKLQSQFKLNRENYERQANNKNLLQDHPLRAWGLWQ